MQYKTKRPARKGTKIARVGGKGRGRVRSMHEGKTEKAIHNNGSSPSSGMHSKFTPDGADQQKNRSSIKYMGPAVV